MLAGHQDLSALDTRFAIARFEGGGAAAGQRAGRPVPACRPSRTDRDAAAPGRRAPTGTAGPDVFTGTWAPTSSARAAGSDRLRGGPGGDLLCGEAGNDTVDGERAPTGSTATSVPGAKLAAVAGEGNDVVRGGAGSDRLVGGGGRDKLDGGAGHDRLDGGAGRDKLSGGAGRDRLSGGVGNDTLAGGAGRNRYAGGAGNDKVSAVNGTARPRRLRRRPSRQRARGPARPRQRLRALAPPLAEACTARPDRRSSDQWSGPRSRRQPQRRPPRLRRWRPVRLRSRSR